MVERAATAITNLMNNKSTNVSTSSFVVDAVLLRKVLRLVHCLQKERGASCAYKASCRSSSNNKTESEVRRKKKQLRKHVRFLSLSAAALKPARKDTDRALEMLLEHTASDKKKQSEIRNFVSIRVTLEKLRKMLITPKESTGTASTCTTALSMNTQQSPPPPKNQTTSASGFHRILVCYNALIQSIVHDYILKYTRHLPLLHRNNASSIKKNTAATNKHPKRNTSETADILDKSTLSLSAHENDASDNPTNNIVNSSNNNVSIPRNFSLQYLDHQAFQLTPIKHRRVRTLSQSKTSLLDSIQDFYHHQQQLQQQQGNSESSQQQQQQDHRLFTDNNHYVINHTNNKNDDVFVDRPLPAPMVHPCSDPQRIVSMREFNGVVRHNPGGGFSLTPPPVNLLPATSPRTSFRGGFSLTPPPANLLPTTSSPPRATFLCKRMSTVSDTDATDDYDYEYSHHETSNNNNDYLATLHHANHIHPSFGHHDHKTNFVDQQSVRINETCDEGKRTKNTPLLSSSLSTNQVLFSDNNDSESDSSSTSSSNGFSDFHIESISDDNNNDDDDDNVEVDQMKNLDHLVRLLKLLDSFVRLKEATGVQRATLSSLLAAGQIESRMLVTDLVIEVENHRHLLEQLKQQKFVGPQVVDNVLHNLVQEVVTMSPAMQQLQNAILQGFDLNALKDEFQNSPSQLWNLLTLYMDKLHSLELLIVEEIDCCSDYFNHYRTVVELNKKNVKSTTIDSQQCENNKVESCSRTKNEGIIDGSFSIIVQQDEGDEKQPPPSLGPQHQQQQISARITEDSNPDLIKIAYGMSSTDPMLLHEIIEKMPPEEMKQRLMDAIKTQQYEPGRGQQPSSPSYQITNQYLSTSEVPRKEQLEQESPLPSQEPKQVQPELEQQKQQQDNLATSPLLFPELAYVDDNNNKNKSDENKNREITPSMKAVEDLLLEISKAPASKEWEIDLYEIQFRKRIGQGAAGTTYLADWCDLQVAVKVASINEMGLDGWRTEVQALQKLHHPNIIRLLGSVYHPNPLTFCLVLEYCDAGDLSNALLKATPRNFFFQVATGASRGMSYLHSRGVIHRDIKPGNILLHGNVASGQFQVKVTDFGVATDSSSRANRTAETGTYRWMAPEVIRHENYTQTADIYSFAVVMWQLLTREEPFHDRGQIAAAAAVAIENTRPPIPDQTPVSIQQLIVTCWDSDPSQRLPFDKITGELYRIEKALTEEEQTWLQAPLGHWVYKNLKKSSNNNHKHPVGERVDPDNKNHHPKGPILLKRSSWHGEAQQVSANPSLSLILPSAKDNKKRGLKSIFSRKVRYY